MIAVHHPPPVFGWFCLLLMKKTSIKIYYAGGLESEHLSREQISRWFDEFDELQILAEVSVSPIRVSEGSLGWLAALARRIIRDWNSFDGCVVSFTPDFFIIGSTILQQLMPEAGKPVVCVSAPLTSQHDNAYGEILYKASMLNAVQVALSDVAGVLIQRGNTLVGVEQNDDMSDGKLVTVGSIDFGIQLQKNRAKRSRVKPAPSAMKFDTVSYVRAGSRQARTEELARAQAKHFIIDGGARLQLGVEKQVPAGKTALLLSEQAAYLYMDGSLREVDAPTRAIAAARYVVALESGGESALEQQLGTRL